MQQSIYHFPAAITVLADGVSQDGKTLRLSLSVTPDQTKTASGPWIDLRDWPKEIASLADKMSIALATLEGGQVLSQRLLSKTGRYDLRGTGFSAEATALWRRIFTASDAKGFDHLAKVIDAREAGEEQTASKSETRFTSYLAADLAGLVDSLYLGAGERALSQRLADEKGLAPATSDHLTTAIRSKGQLDAEEWTELGELVPWGRSDPVGLFGAQDRAKRLAQIGAESGALAAQFSGKAISVANFSSLASVTEQRVSGLKSARPRFQGLDGPSLVEPLSNPVVARELTRFAFSRGMVDDRAPTSPRVRVAAQDFDAKGRQAAGRKFTSLFAYPTLAKYFGLIVDLEIDLADIGDLPPIGAIAALFDGVDIGSALNWTAYDHRKAPKPYFGVRSKASETSKAPLYQDGIIDLNHELNGIRRFDLMTLDAHGITRLLDRASSIEEARRNGRSFAEIDSALPDLPERGIALIDRMAPVNTLMDVSLDANKLFDGAVPTINYAEDLVRGIVLDVATSNAAGDLRPDDRSRWRTLMARDLTFGIDPAFLAHKAVQRVRSRDEGFSHYSASSSDQPGGLTVNAPVELVCWMGESLGVPVNTGSAECRVRWADPVEDLAIGIDFRLPGAPAYGEIDRRPPPLRFGRRYYVGARLSYVNGCGPSLDDAIDRYCGASRHCVLGESDGRPYAFKRRRFAKGPEVLLPSRDRLVKRPEIAPGETIETLVVRSHGVPTANARRIVIPAAVEYDQAELHGLLDDPESIKRDVPKGAFEGRARAVLDPALGSFPVARDRGWELPQKPDERDQTAREQSRGAVFVHKSSAKPAVQPYFPDPLARRFYGALRREDGAIVTRSEPFPFWSDQGHPRDVLPVMIEVVRGQKDLGEHQRVSSSSSRARIDDEDGMGSLSVRRMSVALAPAEDLYLDLTTHPDLEDMLAKLHGPAEAMGNLLRREPGLAPANWLAILESLLLRGSVSTWTPAKTLRLVHAVEQPLERPSIHRIRPVVLTVAPSIETASKERPTWQQYVAGHDVDHLSSWESHEGGASTFFVGTVGIDRPSTGRLRCDGRWLEHGPNGLRQDADGWRYDPPSNFARLFQIEHIPAKGGKAVDLIFDETESGTPRRLAFSFPDGRARRLDLQLIATSRFTEFYDGGNPQRHELVSAGFDDTPDQIVVPCTFRPPVAEIDRILPVFSWKRTVDRARKTYTFSRQSILRVHLKPSIYASGVDEMFALLFFNEAGKDLCDFEARTGLLGQSTTQWGSDPSHLSPGLAPVPPLATVGGWNDHPNHKLLMPPPSAPDDLRAAAPSGLPVEILAYRPQIDLAHGAYFDVEIDPGASYAPFIRLGISRYQPHAIEGLELSRPITKWAQILPWRSGTARMTARGRVAIEVKGPAYSSRRVEGAGGPDGKACTLFNFKLMRLVDTTPMTDDLASQRWLPAIDEDGRAIAIREVAGGPCHEGPGAPEPSGLMAWACELELPRVRSRTRYGIMIEEVEWVDQAPDLLADGRESDVYAIQRGPVFLHTIDLGLDAELPDLPRPAEDRGAVDHNDIPVSAYLTEAELDLAGPAARAASMLKERFPSLIFTSGRRTISLQAAAMARNVLADRYWIKRTYRKSKERHALQTWVDANWARSGRTEIADGLEAIMSSWSQPQLLRFSHHFAGLAFDLLPSREPGVKAFIKALPGLSKFITREGDLDIWHLEFKPDKSPRDPVVDGVAAETCVKEKETDDD